MNNVCFNIFGMRRSGNHAILHWVADHFNTKPWLIHNTSFNKPNPEEDFYEHEDFYDYRNEDFNVDRDVLIQTFEDCDITNLDWKANAEVVGKSVMQFNMIIIRDPLNWLASRYAKPEWPAVKITPQIIDFWNQHYKECMGWTSYLKRPIVVSYNMMVKKPDCLESVEDDMFMSPSGIKIKPGMGIGSSFNDEDYLNRWKKFENDPTFMKLANDLPYRNIDGINEYFE